MVRVYKISSKRPACNLHLVHECPRAQSPDRNVQVRHLTSPFTKECRKDAIHKQWKLQLLLLCENTYTTLTILIYLNIHSNAHMYINAAFNIVLMRYTLTKLPLYMSDLHNTKCAGLS